MPLVGNLLDTQLKRLLDRDYVKATPSRPQRLWDVLTADLPAAADWQWCELIVSDAVPPCIAFSDGTNWLRADGSAL